MSDLADAIIRPLYRLRVQLHQVAADIDRHALFGEPASVDVLRHWLALLDGAEENAQECVDAIDDAVEAPQVAKETPR